MERWVWGAALAIIFQACSTSPVADKTSENKVGPKLDIVVQDDLNGFASEPNKEALLADATKLKDLKAKVGTRKAIMEFCESFETHIFCQAFNHKVQSGSNSPSNTPRRHEIRAAKKLLEKGQFEELKEASLSLTIQASRQLRAANLLSASKQAAEHGECLSNSVYVGLSSVLEVQFPKEEALDVSQKLLNRALECADDENSQKGAFRLAMIMVWQNNCKGAVPIFEKPLKSKELDYLHTRSLYWQNWCNSPEQPQSLSQYPLSFHSLLKSDGSEDPYLKVKANPEPEVVFRSTHNIAVNNAIITAEAFKQVSEPDFVTHALSRLKIDDFANIEPGVLLYTAHLLNQVKLGLLQFQILANLFSTKPEYKSLASMKLFYPLWHLDDVKSQAEDLDPYLILSLIRQESAFQANARSSRNARGLMQLIPITGRKFGRVSARELYQPQKNILAGTRFFNYLLRRFKEVHLALAAYNAGPKTVEDWLKRYPTDNPLLFMDLMPYRETREYVASIMRNWYWYHRIYSESDSFQFPFQTAQQ